jgi:methylmalonyl-CoA mutase
MDVNAFGPRLSFFLDCGLDVEYLVLTHCRKSGRRYAPSCRRESAQGTSAHQTSGRSLIANNSEQPDHRRSS